MLIKCVIEPSDADEYYQFSLKEFVNNLVRYLPFSKVPPYRILNLYLVMGEVDGGMSGGITWDSFSIEESVYNDELASLNEQELCNIPEEIKTIDDWFLWCFQILYGLPMSEQRELYLKSLELEKKSNEAYDGGDKEKGDQLHWELVSVSEELDKIWHKYMGV
jgi:hypothetical protein